MVTKGTMAPDTVRWSSSAQLTVGDKAAAGTRVRELKELLPLSLAKPD